MKNFQLQFDVIKVKIFLLIDLILISIQNRGIKTFKNRGKLIL